MKRYDSYKDSGVEWIGEIPTSWSKLKIKHLFSHTKGKNGQKLTKEYIGNNPGEYPVYSGTTKGEGHLGRTNEYEFDTCGEDVIFVSTVGSDTTVMSTKVLKGRFNLSQNCLIMTPKFDFSTKYQYYFTIHDFPYQRTVLPIVLKEGHRSVGMGELNELISLLPPLFEQQQIVSFLDTKTSLIDSLIEKTQRKIELLKEKRTSLINEVVTKGLNPNVEMKDSGVEWIGEIPSGWETPQIRFVTELMRGKFTHRPRNDQRFYNGEYPFIQTGDIVSSGKYLTKFKQTLNERGYSVSKEFPIGTLVMTISGNIGDVSILKIKSCFPDSIIGFFPFDNTSVDYLYHVFNSLRQEFYKNSTVSTQMNLNVDRVGSIKIPLPTINEQQQIVEYLDEQTGLIDNTISIEEKRIELLKEYRQSIISEVVTGKQKVVESENLLNLIMD